ncbi:M56 family metallopeptidase [Paenibacillus piri]|uniref:Peptidase M56 domain-containing protein n=1 Tax=Paenibacillus piri TaxID=2547395 RepID=A0A4R5KG77_9BACL|nr:M56 family metallopeptidase [Paenibacillus piri]TDF94419.1 hypothetical protein E1757_23690 [Paenibacillus piri]
MNRLTEHLINLFDWVCSVSIMATVLVMLILVTQLVLKHRLKPRWHYLMWLLVVLRLMLPWGPESELSIYNWIGYTESVHSAVQLNQDELRTRAVMPESPGQAIYRNVFVIWLVGVCLLGTYTIWINRKFAQKMKKETAAITDARVLELFNRCKKMMAVHKPIALMETGNLATPALFGFIKPQLIMPQTILTGLNDDQLQHVFLHELAHSKRNDIGVNWIMHGLLIVHWFNPVLWYAYRRMREDQEIASDALALSCLAPDKTRDYGYTLIKLLENFSQPVRVVAGNVNLTGSKTQLQRRVKMIKQFKSNSYRWSFLGMATLIFISGCTLTNPKVSQTSAQLSSGTVSEETATKQSASAEQHITNPEDTAKQSASAEQHITNPEDTSKQTAVAEQQPTSPENAPKLKPSAGQRPTTANDPSSPQAPLEVQSPAPDVKPSPKAPGGVMSTAPNDRPSEDSPRAQAPVRVQAAGSDGGSRPAPPAKLQPTATEDRSRAAAPEKAQPIASEDRPKAAPPIMLQPTASTGD